jgi:colanic acid/amylovoran biosynthesis protein
VTRFYLTGHKTFGNRGCEAIVRSTVSALRQTFDQIEVLVPSGDIERDSRQWPDAAQQGVRFVEAYVPGHARFWTHSQRLPLKFLKRAGWPFPFPKVFREQIKSVDAVLSIGGDNYSLDYRLPSLLMGIDRFAMDLGKPVFIWGASVGPFEAEPYFVPTIRHHLSKVAMIAARESITYDYLTKTLALTNVTQMADPAFTLAKAPVDVSPFWPQSGQGGTLGLNVSPLLERYKAHGQDLRAETIQFIREAVAKGYSVLLVPHVIPLDGAVKNNDAIYMTRMLEEVQGLGESVSIVPSNLNASQIKQVISQQRFFIGARTHATIAALSSGVPTLSIAYSVKAKGINQDLFGDMPIILPTPDLSATTLMAGLDYLLANETEIKAELDRKLPRWRGRVATAAQVIREGIENST